MSLDPEAPTKAAPDWLTIQFTPADLARSSMAGAELVMLAEQQARSPDGRLDDEALADLARSGWMRQDVHARGSYISTLGLRERLDHPELVMLNVPSSAGTAIAETFNSMATYLDDHGRRFEPGQLYLEESAAPAAFTFAELGEEAAESIGFGDLWEPLLVVIPLP